MKLFVAKFDIYDCLADSSNDETEAAFLFKSFLQQQLLKVTFYIQSRAYLSITTDWFFKEFLRSTGRNDLSMRAGWETVRFGLSFSWRVIDKK